MGIFDLGRGAKQEDVETLAKSVDTLTSSIGKLIDAVGRLSLLVQEQHAAIAELYMVQTQVLKLLSTDSMQVDSIKSTHRKSSKMN